ncbi:MAG TPA: FecR domain-containing protein [Puia sp.]|nr:FecR domain-containing protein [Puia sp.]
MGKDRISYLLQQYSSGQATKGEVEELFGLLSSEESQVLLKDLILDQNDEEEAEIALPLRNWDRMWYAIRSAALSPARKGVFSLGWVRVAAAVIVVVTGAAVYLGLHKSNINNKTIPLATVHTSNDIRDIRPGGNKAVLTLANGATIVLDSAHDGLIGQQGNTSIVKVDAGALAYDTKSKHTGEVLYNAISTPRGGQYQVILPDGSKVWLNAASSLRFPTSFVGKERLVELTGEAYFEIAKNAAMPFRVFVVPPLGSGREGMNVQVLGTHFNIKAYENEQSIRTTLLEGAVKVGIPALSGVWRDGGQEVTLVPGRQAIADNAARSLQVADANTEQVVAWKNGMFRFKETSIRELMREVERWYNVDVIYNTVKTDQDFTGIVPRTRNISELLHTLELTGTVHFQIEGKKIIVLP